MTIGRPSVRPVKADVLHEIPSMKMPYLTSTIVLMREARGGANSRSVWNFPEGAAIFLLRLVTPGFVRARSVRCAHR